jgi:dienelactone hydrolase
MRGFIVGAVVVAALMSMSAGAAPRTTPYASLVRIYDYNAAAPLDVREESVSDAGEGIMVHSLSFASPKGGRATAELVLPAHPSGRVPAVIVQPGFGSPADDAVTDEVALARLGFVAISLDSPHVRPLGPRYTCRVSDRKAYIQYVIDLRRTVDLLTTRPEVDPSRLGYAGFSMGAIVGGTLSGVDHRVKAFALQSGGPRFSLVQRNQCRGVLSRRRLTAYTRALRFADSINYVGHAAPSALLFQNGTRDPLYTRKSIRRYFAAASKPKTLRWYRSGHDLPPRATADRTAFLRAQLGF